MKKSVILAVSSLLVSSFVLSACGSSEKPAAQAPSQGESSGTASQPVKLRFWGGIQDDQGPSRIVEKWNAANKDIQVEYVRFVNDDAGNTKLDVALLSNNDSPDLYMSYSSAVLERRVRAGMAEPLEELMKKVNFNIDENIGTANIIKHNDKIYHLPGSKGFQLMLINMAALEAAGEKVPTDWTWDEAAALMKKLTKPGQYGGYFNPLWEPIAMDVLNTAQPVNAFYTQDGLSNFDHPAMKKGLELQKDLLNAKALYPFAEGLTAKITPQDELLKGRAAMVFTGTYLIRHIKDDKAYPNRNFKVAFAPLPQMQKGGKVNTGGLSDFVSINANSKNKEAAAKFLAWYLNEGNQELIPGGRIPSSKKINMDAVADKIIGESGKYIDKESLVRILKSDTTFRTVSKTTAAPELRKTLIEEAEKYFMGVQDINKTVEQLKKRGDEAIKSAK